MQTIIGYIPAGGKGTRMKPFRLFKEMLPIVNHGDDENKVILLIENAIHTLVKGGAGDIVCTINKEKSVIINSINDYYLDSVKVNFAFTFQENNNKYGLPYAIAEAAPFLKGHTVFMKFPDTIVYPQDCFKQLYEFHKAKKADLTLGVFPTDHAERLAPVIVDDNGKVIKIEDKPKKPMANNTWNILIWDDRFLNLLLDVVHNTNNDIHFKRELLLMDVFTKAFENKLDIFAYIFEDGFCQDISCIDDMTNMWNGAHNLKQMKREADVIAK